jgi:O-antigen ligase
MPSSLNPNSHAPVSSRFQLVLERLLAYAIVISPPVAGAVTVTLLIRHRGRLRQLWRESWTLGVFVLLGALSMISAVLAESQRTAIQGLAGIFVLFIAWLVGWMAVDHPKRFWRDLQRGIWIVALVTAAWTLRPFTLQFNLGVVTIPIAVPHDPVAVFGLGANGLGPLMVFGAVLALGRLHQSGHAFDRVEAFAIVATALSAALMIGVRSTMLGALAGTLTLMLSTGPAGGLLVLVVILITAATIYFRPEVWTSLMDLTSAGQRKKLWASALRMARDHAWFGVGPFHFVRANTRYMAGDPDLPLRLGPHNIYLRMLAEWGIPAAFLLFAWLFSWPLRMWEHRMEIWRWSFVAGLVAYLVMGIFDDPLFTMHVSASVFAGIGLASSDLARSPKA